MHTVDVSNTLTHGSCMRGADWEDKQLVLDEQLQALEMLTMPV